MTPLTLAGPVLVHFFDFAHLNSVRTLPYVERWHGRYREHGLTVLGVQAPRFEFGADPVAVAAGLTRLGVSFPTAIDADRAIWRDYGCEGWPSLFLWGKGGTLRWFHFGEGEYLGTEEAIQQALHEIDALRPLPDALPPMRASDAPGAMVAMPTPELFPVEGRPWTSADGDGLELTYEAGGAYATVEGEGSLAVELDGSRIDPVRVAGAGLYPLAEHPGHERHDLAVDLSGEVGIWSISFSAGVPP
jgi:hypothetical protein